MPDIFNSLQLQKSQQPANVFLLCCLKTLVNLLMFCSSSHPLKYITVPLMSGSLYGIKQVKVPSILRMFYCYSAASKSLKSPKMGIFYLLQS